MTKIRKSTKVLAIVATILVIAFSIMLFIAFGEDAYADSVDSNDTIAGEDSVIDDTVESDGNWFTDNWKTIVEIFTSGTALAVVLAIIKFIGKVGRLRKDLGVTNTDNIALKGAFNDMADELETQAKRSEELQAQNTMLLNKMEVIENKCSAVLTIFERLISSSDLPTETKVAYQGVINKADGAEDSTNDQD